MQACQTNDDLSMQNMVSGHDQRAQEGAILQSRCAGISDILYDITYPVCEVFL